LSIHGSWDRRRPLSRREFVGVGGMSAAAVLLGTGGIRTSRAMAAPPFGDDPFKLGVGSGDPLPDGVVLWTRLAPEPLLADGSGGMRDEAYGVRYEVAEDEGFRKVVKRGAVEATPELGHSVHPEISGLRPGWEYFYRFKVGPEISPVGRTKTAPAADAAVESMRFATVSCQDWQDGFYTTLGHLADEDLDVVFHLGDYIYEYGNYANRVRGHDTPEIFTLADYRARHSLYKTDPLLRAAHASAPYVVTWDDHDIDNNWAGDVPQSNDAPNGFLARRADAFQAFYENLPLRVGQRPVGPNATLYRRLRWGLLADFSVLDTRQYRSDQACGDGNRVVRRGETVLCEAWDDADRTVLGATQQRWLFDGLASSPSRWRAIPQQVPVGQWELDNDPETRFRSMDTWNGYPAATRKLLQFIADREVSNAVILSGDVHAHLAHDLTLDMEDPDTEPVAVDLVATSLTSGKNGSDVPSSTFNEQSNPHMRYHLNRRGYLVHSVTPQQWRTDYRVVPYVTSEGAPLETRKSFVVETGRPGLQEA